MTAAPSNVDLKALRLRANNSLYFFAKGVLRYDWLVPHIHLPLCRLLEDRTITRKGVIFPRGWLKTTVCSIAYPLWRATLDPNVRVLLVQNTATNACKKLASIAGQVRSNSLFRAMYPELLPGSDSPWRADSICLTRSKSYPESTFESAGTGTAVTSRHYDVIIEDDTVAPESDELGQESLAPTQDQVEQAIGWHRLITPLFNNPSTDESIVVGTRWYERDLFAYIRDNEPEYHILSRACREDDLGQPDPKGHVTYPERFSAETLDRIERALGPYMYSCLYMNQPVRRADMLFRPEWFKYYETLPPRRNLSVWTTVDPATDPELANSADTDYSVVMTCAKDLRSGIVYVLDYFREKCSPGEMTNAIFRHASTWHPLVVAYENVAYQKSIDYWLKELMRAEGIYFLLQGISRGRKAKETAIAGLQPVFASGTILLRPWMQALVSELLAFPRGAHDDLADALSMQCQLWRRTRSDTELIKRANDDHPLSFASVERELRHRHRQTRGPVYDPLAHLGSVHGVYAS